MNAEFTQAICMIHYICKGLFTRFLYDALCIIKLSNRLSIIISYFIPIRWYIWNNFINLYFRSFQLDRNLPLGSDGLGEPAELPKPVFTGIYHTYENQEAVIVGHAAESSMSQDLGSSLKDKPMVFPKKLLIGRAKVLPKATCIGVLGGYLKIDGDPLCAKVPPSLTVQGYCKVSADASFIFFFVEVYCRGTLIIIKLFSSRLYIRSIINNFIDFSLWQI